jgi:SAM-dependent methyltransferase
MRFIACEVCGSSEFQVLFKGWDRVYGLPGLFPIVQCRKCSLLFINPQPEEKELKAYYPKAYYSTGTIRYREYSWLRKRVLEEYFGYRHSTNSSKSLRYFKKILFIPLRARYRNAIPFIPGGRLLDIGCGNGTELYKLKAMGWKTYGVELDEEAASKAKSLGLEVFTGNLFGADYPDHYFHVVRMSFVLEHLPNPKETLQEIKRILLPYGRLYISIHNARSLNYWLFGERWYSFDVPRHLFSFSPKTIKRLLSSLDLRVKAIQFDSGTRTFLGSLQYWMNDRHHRGALVQGRQAFMENHLLRHLVSPVCWSVDRVGLGDLIHLEIVQI